MLLALINAHPDLGGISLFRSLIESLSHKTAYLVPLLVRTYALAELTPQPWGQQDLTPPELGGRGANRRILRKSC
jgi:hypothetical protein